MCDTTYACMLNLPKATHHILVFYFLWWITCYGLMIDVRYCFPALKIWSCDKSCMVKKWCKTCENAEKTKTFLNQNQIVIHKTKNMNVPRHIDFFRYVQTTKNKKIKEKMCMSCNHTSNSCPYDVHILQWQLCLYSTIWYEQNRMHWLNKLSRKFSTKNWKIWCKKMKTKKY